MIRVAILTLAAALAAGTAAAQPPSRSAGGLSPETRQKLVASLEKASAFLRANQQPDGTWEKHPGITALVAAALLKQPGANRAEQLKATERALDYLKSLQKPDGGMYEKDLPHYITSVAIMALHAGGRPEDKDHILKARDYIVANMIDESEGAKADDIMYGGMGYGSAPRPDRRTDMISTEYALRALRDAALPEDNAAWDKALLFLQRTQNLSETNDQKFAANDGGFMYYPGFSYHEQGGTRSYGSVTYAGLLSYTYANLKKDDPRVKGALKWIRDNYTVDENPGLGQKTVYYYYMVFARALQAVGEDVIVDAKGQRRNWREDLGRKLLELQYPEGYWVNTEKWEWQDNKVLVTAFTMAAIEAILK
ncbi:MAG TPA: prenyltransferase/squalene oxidase repeat-containing protein [Vicinamibacterales bacterium]|nr:prenyltransferase/squalene oxidase repeat-containing protein [Vicinamibacterales bacterium]